MQKNKVIERIIRLSEEKSTGVIKGMPKKVSMFLIVALVICGGGVLAFLAIGSSPKIDYFKAEIDTYEYFEEQVKDRFQHELDWLEVTENNPVESTVDISAQFNDPGFFGYGMMFDIEEMINNSSISFSSQTDMKNKQLVGEFDANIAGLDLSDFRFSLTEDTALIDLPFLNDVLMLEDEHVGSFLHMLDPQEFDADTELDFSKVFDSSEAFLTEEDKKHFKDTYGQLIYNELDEGAFSSEKETIEIENESVSTEKIELSLAEEDVQQLFKSILEEMKSDDYLKDLMRDQFEMNLLSTSEIDEMFEEFDEGIEMAIDEIDEINLPNGLTSTVWIDRGLIVKRSFEMTTLDDFDEEVKIELVGTQLLENDSQMIDYDITLEDSIDQFTFNINGDFLRDGNDINDSFMIALDQFEIVYEADEILTNQDREFTRSLGFSDGMMSGELVWSGNTTYEADQMQGSHQLYIEADDISQDLFTLNLDVTGKQIKEIDMLDDEDSLNIGTMSEQELFEYVETEAADQFMSWYFELLGGMGDFF